MFLTAIVALLPFRDFKYQIFEILFYYDFVMYIRVPNYYNLNT